MQIHHTVKDEFAMVISGMYGYVSLITFILPMYSYILRIQIEKQSGIQRHLAIVGLSQSSQMLAMFCSYATQVTLIAFNVNLVMYMGDLFPQSFQNSKLLMFLFSWSQGISNFGFIIMISALLPQDMHPKLAAKCGTLIYFGSSFADFTVQRQGVAEKYKIFISLIFPSVATTRACKNLSLIEH